MRDPHWPYYYGDMGTEVRGAEGTGTPRKTNEKMERAEEIISDPGEHFPLEHRFVILFEGKISIIRGDSVVPEYDVLLHYSILIRH